MYSDGGFQCKFLLAGGACYGYLHALSIHFR